MVLGIRGHRADPDAESGVVLPAQGPLDALETVVAAGRPAPRSRNRPIGRAKSSTRMSRSRLGSKSGASRHGASAAPLRFMYVWGFRRRTS